RMAVVFVFGAAWCGVPWPISRSLPGLPGVPYPAPATVAARSERSASSESAPARRRAPVLIWAPPSKKDDAVPHALYPARHASPEPAPQLLPHRYVALRRALRLDRRLV